MNWAWFLPAELLTTKQFWWRRVTHSSYRPNRETTVLQWTCVAQSSQVQVKLTAPEQKGLTVEEKIVRKRVRRLQGRGRQGGGEVRQNVLYIHTMKLSKNKFHQMKEIPVPSDLYNSIFYVAFNKKSHILLASFLPTKTLLPLFIPSALILIHIPL